MEEYARKYDGKAVALMARQTLLSMEFEELERDGKGTSGQYRALREKCDAFEKARKAFSGSEKRIADCCEAVRNMIGQLDDQFVSFSIEDGLLTASLRNLGGITVTVKDSDGKDKVWSTRLENPARSFYALDTVKVQFPAFDDGIYNVECSEGKVSSELQYRRFGLSAAQKEDARGYAVYVARAKSLCQEGRPEAVLAVLERDVDQPAGRVREELRGVEILGPELRMAGAERQLGEELGLSGERFAVLRTDGRE